MGYPLLLARRYLASKKRDIISISTLLAIFGVTLGVAALAIVMSVTGGFQEQFREKVLGVNAHVLVLKYSVDFREYRDVMKKVEHVPGVIGVAPFVINPMMVTHEDRTATGVLLKGVDPELLPKVLDLPKHIVEGSMKGLRKADAKPPERTLDSTRPSPFDVPSRKSGSVVADTDGGVDPLMLSITQQIEEEKRAIEEGDTDAGARPKTNETRAADEPPPIPRNAPVGSITPTGGFKSDLPDDDVLPETIDPEPCKSAQKVGDMPGVIIGRSLSKQLNAQIGDCVQITSPMIGIAYGASSRPPVAKQFRVIAIFEAGFDQYDSKLVYTDLYEAQAFYEYGDSVTGVEMRVDDIDRAPSISKEIDGLLSNGVYHTMDWRELNHGLFTALLIQQIGMSSALALIIVVATFTVIATLIMLVLDKTKEIALLKAIGARDGAIMRVFIYQGVTIGIVGTALGLTIGYLVCRFLLAYAFPLDPKVYFISRLPVSFDPMEFVITGGFAIAICLNATILPALYASELRPADGLRGSDAASTTTQLRDGLVLAWRTFKSAWISLVGTHVMTSAFLLGVPLLVTLLMIRFRPSFFPNIAPAVLFGAPVVAFIAVWSITGPKQISAWVGAAKNARLARSSSWSIGSFVMIGLVRFGILNLGLSFIIVPVAVYASGRSLSSAHVAGLAALACLFVPGNIALLGTSFAPFLAVHHRLGPVAALRASWQLTRGCKGAIFAYLVLGALLQLLAAGGTLGVLMATVLDMYLSQHTGRDSALLGWVQTNAVPLGAAFFFLVMLARLYFSGLAALCVRREDASPLVSSGTTNAPMPQAF